MEKNIEMLIVRKSMGPIRHVTPPLEPMKEDIYLTKFYFYPRLFKMISKMILFPIILFLWIWIWMRLILKNKTKHVYIS